jgi:hypothetical protein
MIKKEFGKQAEKDSVLIINPFDRCLCGQPYDGDGICSNGHFRGAEYFVPKNQARKPEEKRALDEMKLREKYTNLCSICGAHISEGDNICERGHACS